MAVEWVKTAQWFLTNGISVAPILRMWDDPEHKSYDYKWQRFQSEAMTEAEASREFARAQGIAIIGGIVSGCLVVIDFDRFTAWERWQEYIRDSEPELFDSLVIEQTPKGGRHVFIRVPELATDMPRNAKWAMVNAGKDKYTTAIETRGEGGLVFCAPTEGYKLVQGKFDAIPEITAEQFEMLKGVAVALDEKPAKDPLPAYERKYTETPGDKPWDVYDANTSWDELMPLLNGHSPRRTRELTHWTRPGKKYGTSAITGLGRDGQDLLQCHSSNWHPLEVDKRYTKYTVYKMLVHGGDAKKACRAISERFGLVRTIKRAAPLEVVHGNLATQAQPQPQPQPQARPEDGPEWIFTDLGNADEFARAAAGKLLWCADWKRWVVWDGKRWRVDDHSAVGAMGVYRSMIEDLYESERDVWKLLQSKARIEATLTLAKGCESMNCRPDEFDNDPYIINTQDGVVSLTTGTIEEHHPRFMCSKITRCGVHGSEEDDELVEKFLSDICLGDGDAFDALSRFMGYSITGHCHEQKFMLAVGTGRNGKGTLTNTMYTILGDYASTLDSSVILSSRQEKSLFQLETLRGTRFVKVEEPDKRRQLDREFVKKLVAGDPMQVAAKYGHPYDIRPYCKLWILANHKPTVEFDYAFKRRAMVFPFGLHLEDSEVDAKLEEKLVKAGASLLHHMITSAIDYHEAGLLETDAMKSELTSYEEDNDSIALFMEEMIFETEASTDFIESRDMLEKYNDWAKKNALPSMKRQEFSQKMKIKGHVSEKVGHANRKGYRQMVWVGDGPVPHGY